jgi:hypothetical protein
MLGKKALPANQLQPLLSIGKRTACRENCQSDTAGPKPAGVHPDSGWISAPYVRGMAVLSRGAATDHNPVGLTLGVPAEQTVVFTIIDGRKINA